MKFIVVIFLGLVLTSCANNSNKEKEVSNEVVNQDQQSDSGLSVDSFECGMSFSDFFENFACKKEFQISRIKFPLKSIYFDYYSDDPTIPIEELIEQKDYVFCNLCNDDKAKYRDTDKFETKFEQISETTYLYKQIGIDNGILVEYKFELVENCWKLVLITDESS